MYFPLNRPMFHTSGLEWPTGNTHLLGRPLFPLPHPRKLQSDCHRWMVIGVSNLVARSCLRGASNEQQGRLASQCVLLSSIFALEPHSYLSLPTARIRRNLSFIAR